MSRISPCSTTAIRALGIVGIVAALCGIAAGVANALAPDVARNVTFLVPFSLYFLLASVGTLMLRKVAAVLLVGPLFVAAIFVVVASIRTGPPSAIFLNVILSVPFFCAPAFVVYRNWRCLK